MEKTEIKIPVHVQPLHADEANVNSNVKIHLEKGEDGEEIVKKVGKVDILFFDQLTRSIVSRMVIDPYTAKTLGRILLDNADKVIAEVENPEVPEEVKKQIRDREKQVGNKSIKPSFDQYIG